MQQLSAQDLAEHIQNGTAPTIIDVREPYEFEYARIPGAILKPLGDIFVWAQELDKEQAYVMLCHSGSRSYQAAYMLERMGFKHIYNLVGGIDDWSRRVDPKVPRY